MIVVSDIEGPLVNPKFDLAWELMDKLKDEGKIDQNLYDLVKRFDDYDDARWLAERNTMGWSTGTTPVISMLIAAYSGMSDEDIVSFVQDRILINEGIYDMMAFLKEQDVDTYLVSSSAPQQALIAAKELSVPFSRVFCAGNQLQPSQAALLDCKDLEASIDMRSVINYLSQHKETLESFVIKYLNTCKRWVDSKENDEEYNLGSIENYLNTMFDEIQDAGLRDTLTYLLRDQNGMRGGYKKAEIITQLKQDNSNAIIVYIGDSVVDTDALRVADFAITTNCTSKLALAVSDINLATQDMKYLDCVIADLHAGKVTNDVSKYIAENLATKFDPAHMTISGSVRILDQMPKVIEENHVAKTRLQQTYDVEMLSRR